jgi:hypothetical protein
MPKNVRCLLAERFDPDEGGFGLVLKPARSRGRPKVSVKTWEIAIVVERRLIENRDRMKQAVGYAVDKFGVSKRTVETAYAEHKDQMKALGPGLKTMAGD